MINLNLVCLQFEEDRLLPKIRQFLNEILSFPVELGRTDLNPETYYNAERHQYDAASIVSAFEKKNKSGRIILLTDIDLYIPIFTFIFGLAKLNGETGIVSIHRLRNEYYGLPQDQDLLIKRIVKEVVHELGHLLNLRHCPDYQCCMASSNTVDELDVKGDHFCRSCLDKIEPKS